MLCFQVEEVHFSCTFNTTYTASTVFSTFPKWMRWTSTEPKLNFVDLNFFLDFLKVDDVDHNWTLTQLYVLNFFMNFSKVDEVDYN